MEATHHRVRWVVAWWICWRDCRDVILVVVAFGWLYGKDLLWCHCSQVSAGRRIRRLSISFRSCCGARF
jgi:hypothetical protein